MQTYELVVQVKGGETATLPQMPQAYGSFSRGDAYNFRGRFYAVVEVGHEILFMGQICLCRTILHLDDLAPHALMANLAADAARSAGGGDFVGNS